MGKNKIKYNEDAAALTWEILEKKADIGNWELLYKDKLISGRGFREFLSAAAQLSTDINVVYVKKIKYFIYIAKHFVNFKDKKFSGADLDFFYIFICENVELRNWDRFWDNIDDKKDFLNRLELCRSGFNHGQDGKRNVNRLSLENHYQYSLAKDLWKDTYNQYHLYASNWAKPFCQRLLPQSELEYACMIRLDRAGFYYKNPDYMNKTVVKTYHYDIRSAFLAYMVREKYPYTTFEYIEDIKQMAKIIKDKFYCWYGVFHFEKLQYKDRQFPIDLNRFGQPGKGLCNWSLLITNVDWEWFKEAFTWKSMAPSFMFYAQQKELERNYLTMINGLYDSKQAWKKRVKSENATKREEDIYDIMNFRSRLCFGQSIKKVEYFDEMIYSDEEEDFVLVDAPEKSLERIQSDLMRRGIPFYVGLWTAAYARLEFFKVWNSIPEDKFIYGDTDSAFVIGEEAKEIIEQRNRENNLKVEEINKKRKMEISKDLGKWDYKGMYDGIKIIANKWYMTLKGDEIDVKSAGVKPEKIIEYLNSKIEGSRFKEFKLGMKIENIKTEIRTSGEGLTVIHQNKLNTQDRREIMRNNATSLFYFDPYEMESD